MPVIVVSNLKGGVGKTSACMHLGGVLASSGKRVLLIDDDPQSSLTQGFWGSRVLTSLPREATIFEVYDGSPQPEQVIHQTPHEGLYLIPGHKDAGFWNQIPEREWGRHEDSLRGLVDSVRDDFDYILIDTPPNLYLCTHAALSCSDWVLVPLQAEDFGAQGTVDVNTSVHKARTRNPGLNVLGYLLTQYNSRLNIHKDYEREIRSSYESRVFETRIPYATDFKEAVTHHLPINHYKKSGAALDSIKSLVQEIEFRIRLRRAVA